MVLKVYVSLISCSQEIKKNQQRTIMILESKGIPYVAIDITDPSQEEAKDWVMAAATPKEGHKVPITPQIFNEADYCGDFDQLDMANECDTLGEFLRMTDDEKSGIRLGITSVLPPTQQEQLDAELRAAAAADAEVAAEPLEGAAVEPASMDAESTPTDAENTQIDADNQPVNDENPQIDAESNLIDTENTEINAENTEIDAESTNIEADATAFETETPGADGSSSEAPLEEAINDAAVADTTNELTDETNAEPKTEAMDQEDTVTEDA